MFALNSQQQILHVKNTLKQIMQCIFIDVVFQVWLMILVIHV